MRNHPITTTRANSKRAIRALAVRSILVGAALILPANARTDNPPDTYSPAPLSDATREKLDALDAPILGELHPNLRTPLSRTLDALRDRGWPARIARGKRSKKEQIEGFEEGFSKTLRSKHLCGKAADIMLYPRDYPGVDHDFWDIKDEIAGSYGLKALDVPSFRDRPHVELATDCDWDAHAMGPVGTWRWARGARRVELVIEREGGVYTGYSLIKREGAPLERRSFTKLRVTYAYFDARNSREEVRVEITERDASGESYTRTLLVEGVTSPKHGYTRATWEAMRARPSGARFERVKITR